MYSIYDNIVKNRYERTASMREITVTKDGIIKRMPKIIKNLRNVIYIILALSLIAAAIIKRADYLDPSNMVTNIAVIAMVAYPVAAIFSLIVKFILGFFTCDELTVTSHRIFGFELMGKSTTIYYTEIAEITSFRYILGGIKVICTDGKKHYFIGLRNEKRLVSLAEFFIKEVKRPRNLSEAFENTSDALDTANELKKYTGLKDMGFITGSELENVRKQIVGL